MASDPKSNRALGATSNHLDVDADEDPLVELARIVSEDGGFSAKPERPPARRLDPSPRDTLADGLEAELLQELETSFSPREKPAPAREAPTPAPTVAREAPAPANARPASPAARTRAPAPPPRAPAPPAERPRVSQEEADPDDLLRSIEEQLSQFERRQAGRFAAASGLFNPDVAEPEPIEEFEAPAEIAADFPFGAPEPPPPPQRDEWQGRRASRIAPFAESADLLDEGADAAPEPVAEEVPPAPRSEYRFRGPADANWDRGRAERQDEPASAPQRPTQRRQPEPVAFDDGSEEAAAFAEPEPAPVVRAPAPAAGNAARKPVAAAEKPAETRRERVAATFPEFDEEPAPKAQPRAPDLASLEAQLSRELEPRYAAAASADKWEDGDAPATDSRVAAAIAPGPSRRAAAARAAAAQRGRSRWGMFAAAIILVAVIGGGAAFYLRGSDSAPSGPPPVIAADEGAVRVDPPKDQAAADNETVGEAVYNRVAGTTPSTDEQVVESSEEPREIARIVLPQSSQSNTDDNVVRPVGGDASAPDAGTSAGGGATATADAETAAPTAAAADAGESEIGPRRVPTFVVKADGSIVATSDAGAPPANPAAAQEEQLAGETEPIKPVPVPTVAITEANAPAGQGSTPAAPLAAPKPPAAEAAAADMETRPTIDEPPAEVAPSAAPADMTAPPAEATVASAEPAAPPVSASQGGYIVQLSSEGSMADAHSAYAKAQQRFPSVLGKLEPQIQQADLGAKGIFYRVRVGPWATRKEAVDVCEALKAAGGNCFVAK